MKPIMTIAEPITAIDPVSNDGESAIALQRPYVLEVTVEGTASFLFHRWSNEDVAAKAAAAKGSATKKTDNVESYVYRMVEGDKKSNLAIPGSYLRGAVINAAKFRQDPRSPRKSAMDLYKAGVVALTERADLGTSAWDVIDRQRVLVQRSAVTRERPAMLAGWRATFDIQVLLPEYISPRDLISVITDAGRLVGVGDFRPTYGRFIVASTRVD